MLILCSAFYSLNSWREAGHFYYSDIVALFSPIIIIMRIIIRIIIIITIIIIRIIIITIIIIIIDMRESVTKRRKSHRKYILLSTEHFSIIPSLRYTLW